MTDEPILKTPGELLAEAREAAGLTLVAVAERTKIPVAQLQAVERDEHHRLSGPLYVKSFMRAYAEAVGVDVDLVLDLYRRSSGEGAASAGAGKPDVWERETVTISRVGVEWGRLLAIGAAGAALVVVVWLVIRLLGGGGDVPSEQPQAGADTVAATAPAAAEAGSGTDTLALGWQSAAASTGPAPGARPPAPAAAAAGEQLPPAVSGAGAVPFADGADWPLRVRLLAAGPVRAEVRCDGESAFRPVRYGPDGAGAPALPARGIDPGRAYAVREGLVVYWAARDHCGLRLDSSEGVEVTVNGQVRDISRLRPGQEIILDAHR